MTSVPIVASAGDLPDAIAFADKHPTARWYVASRAEAFGEPFPDAWGITAAMTGPAVDDDEKKVIQTDVAEGKEDELPAKIVDPDDDGDDDLVKDKDTDHDGAAYRKRLGLVAAIDFEALVAAGYYEDYGTDDAYDEYDSDAEITLTASGAVPITAAFTADQRSEYAKKGVALPDGSFPIPNRRYLKKAIRAIGRASDPDAAKAHIKKRAKALGLTKELPESYGMTAATEAGADLTLVTDPPPILAGADLEAAKQALRERVSADPKAEGSLLAAGKLDKLDKVAHDFEDALHPRGKDALHPRGEDALHPRGKDALHPRGKDGKFITKGGRVITPNGEGTVTKIATEGVHVNLDRAPGDHVFKANQLTNAPTAVAHIGGPGNPPHVNPTTASQHLANAQYHVDQSNKELDSARRTTTPNGFETHEVAAKAHREAAAAHGNAARDIINSVGPKADTNARVTETVEGGQIVHGRSGDPGKFSAYDSEGRHLQNTDTRGAALARIDRNNLSVKANKASAAARKENTPEAHQKAAEAHATAGAADRTAGDSISARTHELRAETHAKLAEDVGGPVTPALRQDTTKAAEGASSRSEQLAREAITSKSLEHISTSNLSSMKNTDAARGSASLRARIDSELQSRTDNEGRNSAELDRTKQALRDRAAKASPFQEGVDNGTFEPQGAGGGGVHGEAAARLTPGHDPKQSTGPATTAGSESADYYHDDGNGHAAAKSIAVQRELKDKGYTQTTAGSLRHLTSPDGSHRITLRKDGSFDLKGRRDDGSYASRANSALQTGPADQIAESLAGHGSRLGATSSAGSKAWQFHNTEKLRTALLKGDIPAENRTAAKELLDRREAKQGLRDRVTKASGPSILDHQPSASPILPRSSDLPPRPLSDIKADISRATENAKSGDPKAQRVLDNLRMERNRHPDASISAVANRSEARRSEAAGLDKPASTPAGERNAAENKVLLDRAVAMHGSDRSKWSTADLRSAAAAGDTQAAAALKVKLRAQAGKA